MRPQIRSVLSVFWLALIFSSRLWAAPPPRLNAYTPIPTARATPQTLTVTGSRLQVGLVPSSGTATLVTSTRFQWTVILPFPGGVALTVRNPDGKTSNVLTVQVLPEPPPPPPPPPPPVPLTITCPANITVASSDGLGVAVLYPAPSTSGGVAPLSVESAPLSGSLFQIGMTVVTVRVTDATGQQQSCQFTVTVTWTPPGPTNKPPNVTAGGNKTITLPATVTLTGAVTDDGLPIGAVVTSLWTVLSGGFANFTNPGNPVTDVSFSASGTYVLRLTAFDTQLSASSDVTVTVNPAASLVTLTAFPIDIALGASTTLTWSATTGDVCATSAVPAVSGWSGDTPLSGSLSVTPSVSGATIFSIICGVTTRSVTVNVSGSTVPTCTSPCVINPNAVEFTASPDHATVTRYQFEAVSTNPLGAIAFTLDLGKPAPDTITGCGVPAPCIQVPITVQGGAINTLYTATVTAVSLSGVGPSAPSNEFMRVP